MKMPITVWRTAMNQNRPYLDLSDAVDSIKFIIEQELYSRSVYNVVTINTSVGHIIETIESQVAGVSIQYVDSEIMNQLSYHVDSRRFRKLGFQFKGDLERGIGDTIRLLRQARSPKLESTES